MELTWNITQLNCYPEQDGLQDVVFTVHWTLNAKEDDYTSSVYGSVGVTLDPSGTYTPYADLTQEQVVGWVKDALGVDQVSEYENGVASMIEKQKNPTVVNPPLPF